MGDCVGVSIAGVLVGAGVAVACGAAVGVPVGWGVEVGVAGAFVERSVVVVPPVVPKLVWPAAPVLVVVAVFVEVSVIGNARAVVVMLVVQVLVDCTTFHVVESVESAAVPKDAVVLWPVLSVHPPESEIVELRVALPPSIVEAWTSNSAAFAALEGAVTVRAFIDTTFIAVSWTFAEFEGASFMSRSVNLFDALGLVGTMLGKETVLVPPRVTEFPENVPV